MLKIKKLAFGKTITLTTGTNRFTGGTNDDTFDAGLSTGSLQTLNSGDQLDGGTGTDELFAVVNSSVTPSRLTSIENVSLTNITTASEVNFGNATGLQRVTNQGSTVGLTVSGVGTGVRVDVTDTATAAQVITFSDVTGSADAATVGLSNVSGAATVSVLGIETLNVVSGGTVANTLATLTTDTATRLNVSGSMGLTITANTIAPLNFVDASANTASGAGVDIDLAVGAVTVIGGTGNDSFEFNVAGAVSATGGAGNDTFDFTGTTNTFTVADSVAGGVGTADVIVADFDDIAGITNPMTATTGGTVTGVERLRLTGFTDDNAARAITLSNISSEITTIQIDGITGATANTTTVNFGAGASTLRLNIAAAISAGDTLVLDAVGTGTSDSLAIVNARTTTDNIGSTTSNITTTDFETVSIDTGSYAVAVAQNLGVVNAGSTAAVTVSGSNNLVLAAGLVAASINASNLGGAAILSMGAASTIGSITGGGNNDVLVGDSSSSINGGAGDDTVTGGTGNDTLIGGAGADTITNSGGAGDSVDGGDGNDTVVATLTAGNTISGGAGNDTLSLAVAATGTTASGVSGFETLTLTAAAGMTQDMSQFVDNNTFTTINSSSAAGAITNAITGASNSVSTLGLTTAITTTFARLVDTSRNSLNVEVTGGQTITALTASDEETLTISSSNSTAAVITALTAADLTTLVITGSGNVSVTAGAGIVSATNLSTVNALAATGAVVVNASTSVVDLTATAGSGGLTLTTGSGADTINGGNGVDVITGGAGNDTISVGDGNDNVTGGTGADRITVGNGTDNVNYAATGATFSVAAGATGVVSGVTVLNSGLTGIDLIFGMSAGDTVTITSGGGNFSTTLETSLKTIAAGAVTNTVAATRGTYNQTTGIWTTNANGSDTILQWDSNGTTADGAVESVVLIGVAAAATSTISAAGLFTIV